MSIQISGSLIPGVVNTPLDTRTRINTLDDITNIELPFVGMRFYCVQNQKTYQVKTLKKKQIGTQEIADASIDSYTEESYASATHNHSGAYAPLVAGKIPLQYFNVQPGTQVVADIAARNALAASSAGVRAYVVDASGDSSVKHGAAEYIWTGGSWTKIAEAESLDLILSWENIQNKPTTFPPSAHNHDGIYAASAHNHNSIYAASAHNHSYNELTNKPVIFPPAAHNHSYNELTDKPVIKNGSSITHFGLTKPKYESALHLKIEASEIADFSTASTVIDTLNTPADCDKIRIFNGTNWIALPATGADASFNGAQVDADMSALDQTKIYFLRYKWYSTSVPGEWLGAMFPASGGGGNGTSTSVSINATSKNWILDGEDSGICAEGKVKYLISATEPDISTVEDGTIVIIEA